MRAWDLTVHWRVMLSWTNNRQQNIWPGDSSDGNNPVLAHAECTAQHRCQASIPGHLPLLPMPLAIETTMRVPPHGASAPAGAVTTLPPTQGRCDTVLAVVRLSCRKGPELTTGV